MENIDAFFTSTLSKEIERRAAVEREADEETLRKKKEQADEHAARISNIEQHLTSANAVFRSMIIVSPPGGEFLSYLGMLFEKRGGEKFSSGILGFGAELSRILILEREPGEGGTTLQLCLVISGQNRRDQPDLTRAELGVYKYKAGSYGNEDSWNPCDLYYGEKIDGALDAFCHTETAIEFLVRNFGDVKNYQEPTY